MNETDRRLAEELRRWTPDLDLPGRISLLSSYIDYWYGPPKHEERAESLKLSPFVPEPLRWLYRSISALNEDAFTSDYSGWTDGSPIVIFNWLMHPSKLTVDSSGFLAFLNENQGVYQCATLSTGDPPVFVREVEEEDWAKHSDWLSDFLLVAIVLELTMQSSYAAGGEFSTHDCNAFAANLLHIGIGHVGWFGEDSGSVYQGDGFAVLAGGDHNGATYMQAVAKSAEALDSLQGLGGWEYWHCEP